ncbi:hypothetical protein [Plesiomonas shigelloides]|uniref:hypothetical protein n=1 Tax=Plesiomonas shigelloides TaxID=703 RepID=UPI000A11260D|nr:hypothetical protein [Plesiomonas shigelloides]
MTKQNMPRLTESQLFTIEALNRIEGFVWPKGAEFYEVDGGHVAYFYGDASGAMASVRIKGAHDKTIINETVTKAEFYSVDGWVRNSGAQPVSDECIVECKVDGPLGAIGYLPATVWNWERGGLTHWRYHKESPATPLLEILLRELPERGGWPEFAVAIVQNGYGAVIPLGDGCNVNYNGKIWVGDKGDKDFAEGCFTLRELASDHETKIVTRCEYEKACSAEITAAFDDAFNSVAEVSAESWPYVDIIIRMIGLLSSSGVKASQDSQNPAEVWLHDALNLIDNKQPSIPTLTNEQCLKFLCTAFRHNEIKGDIEFDDINLGLRMALSRDANHE